MSDFFAPGRPGRTGRRGPGAHVRIPRPGVRARFTAGHPARVGVTERRDVVQEFGRDVEAGVQQVEAGDPVRPATR